VAAFHHFFSEIALMIKSFRLLLLLLGLTTSVWAGEKPAAQLNYPFVPNQGQWAGPHAYEASFGGLKVFLGESGAHFVLYQPDVVHDKLFHEKNKPLDLFAIQLDFPGSRAVKPQAIDSGPVKNHFFLGQKSQWRSNVSAYSKLNQPDIYPGIDLLWAQEEGNLKFDFVVKPNADPTQIRVRYSGAEKMMLKNGRLHMSTKLGELVELAPVAFTEGLFGRTAVSCQFALVNNVLRFVFPAGYDESQQLVIDPVLIFSTYSGSVANNFGFTATPDNAGNFYTAGTVFDVGFPTTVGAYQENFVGNTVDPGEGLRVDIGILKFSPDGSSLLYATYLGGRRDEQAHSLNVNGYNDLVLLGTTRSDNYPVSSDAYDTSYNGSYDIVVSRLSPDGSQLLSSTYLGGTGNDGINSRAPLRYQYADDYRGDLQIADNNDVLIVSLTDNNNLPTTAGTMQPAFGGGASDGLIVRFAESLTSIRWMTYFGGNNIDALYGARAQANRLIVVGGTLSNNLPATVAAHQDTFSGGADGVVAVLNSANGTLQHLSYLGSAGYDQLFFTDVDQLGNIYVNGQTDSNIVTRGTNYNDRFSGQYVARFSATLDSLHWLGRYGAKRLIPDLSPSAFLIDICDNIYVSGWTGRIENPVTAGPTNLTLTNNALQTTSDGFDFYLAAFSRNMLTMSFATYYGGPGSQEHVDGGTSRFDRRGVVYQAICAGCGNDDLPTTPGSWSPTRGGNRCNNAALKLAFELETGIRANFGWVEPPTWCRPVNLQIQNISRIDPAVGYNWLTSDGQISTLENPQFVFTQPGMYSIRLTINSAIACNQMDTLTRYIEVRDQPDLQLPPDTCICESDALILQANVPGNAFSWTGPDGTATTPEFAATSTGQYRLQLTDMYGCEASDSMRITVSECFGQVANVITPNGDGLNDVLQPLQQAQPDYEMTVFNRWGQTVFRSTNALIGWNGINQQNERLVEGGNYVVVLKANFCGTQVLEKRLQLHVAY